MKRGACFRCEIPGHRASEHDEYERKQKEKEKDKGKAKTSPKKDLRSLHALIQSLDKGEKEELLAMTTSNKEKDDDSNEDF